MSTLVMPPWPTFRTSLQLTLMGLMLLNPPAIEGQEPRIRFGYGVSALSTQTWTPVRGPSIGLAVGGIGGWEVGVEYRAAARDTGEIPGYCGFEFCYDGPFDEDVYLRSAGLDVGRTVAETDRLALGAAVRARYFIQGRQTTDLQSGREFDRDEVRDVGLGVRLEARSHSAFVGMRPIAWLVYDRVFSTGCPSDGTCYGSRNHAEAGVGLLLGW